MAGAQTYESYDMISCSLSCCMPEIRCKYNACSQLKRAYMAWAKRDLESRESALMGAIAGGFTGEEAMHRVSLVLCSA